MTPTDAEAAAATLPKAQPAEAFRSGIALLNADRAEILLPAARLLASRHPADARMAQLLGLAARAVGDGPAAYRAFRKAAALAPSDPLIAHSHARTAMEAGRDAVELFEAARRLAPNDGAVIQGHAAALIAQGRAAEADAMLIAMLGRNPLWLDGHGTLAQIRGQHGGDPIASIDSALRAHPASPELHRLRLDTLLKARRPSDAREAAAQAEAVLGTPGWLAWYRAHAASECDLFEEADRAFAATPAPANPDEASLRARHALRAGRPDLAAAIVEPWLGRDPGNVLWPYAALSWRLTEDARSKWLEGDPQLVGVYDLGDRIADLSGLAAYLRSLHTARDAPLDQSVRGGTQTDGNLLLRDDPAIQSLRALLMATVQDHVARLSPPRAGHPTLIARREPLRVEGAWSVRLTDAGYHADHVHTHGWLSSAFYVALPHSLAPHDSPDKAGWLALGECRELAPALAPLHMVEPKPGRLVLFPSTMWHGTRPFPAGERLTVAFDIARPRQD